MSSTSPVRICAVVTSCLVTLFLFLKIITGSIAANAFTYSLSARGASGSIGNKTLGFEKIFVINAPWRTDRKDSISIAASYSGIDLDWIQGINASEIHESAYPPGNHRQVTHGGLGSWRAHMNAMREIVVRNLSTTLILEDDADWDFRIRDQLVPFAEAAGRVPDIARKAKVYNNRHPPASEEKNRDMAELAKQSSLLIPAFGTQMRDTKKLSAVGPYGGGWDILWLGHCGAELPPPSPKSPDRMMLADDDTVAALKHLKPMGHAPQDAMAKLYPAKTRIYHRTSNSTLCTLAYAVTQSGARKILYQFGVRDFSKGYDFALSDYCAGTMRFMVDEDTDDAEAGIRRPMCVTVQPPLFSHFWPERGISDITTPGAGGIEMGTRYIRRSVRGSIEALVKGEDEVVEQWGDE